MFRHYFEGIEDVAMWPIAALIIFLVVFIAGMVYAISADKDFLEYMKRLPLDEEEESIDRKK